MATLFVTGGSRGIGRAIVLAALAHGYDVAFTYRQQRESADGVCAEASRLAPNRRCLAYELDVRNAAAVEEVGDRVLDEFSSVEVVVANAASNVSSTAAFTTDEQWQEVIDTNLSGSFFTSRYFLPTFVANGFGRFVFVSSIAALGMAGQVAYSASKAGLSGLSGTLAKEYGSKGITSNVVLPGLIETDMSRTLAAPAMASWWKEHCPAGRLGTPDEVAQVVLFLASSAFR